MVAIQAKRYRETRGELGAVRKSFTDTLESPEHPDVTHYVWCSAMDMTASSDRVTGRRKRFEDLQDDLQTTAASHYGRKMKFGHIGPTDLTQLFVKHLSAAVPLVLGDATISLDTILRTTVDTADAITDRLAILLDDRSAEVLPSPLDKTLASLDDGPALRGEVDAIAARIDNALAHLDRARAEENLPSGLKDAFEAGRYCLGHTARDWRDAADVLTAPVGDRWPAQRLAFAARAAAAVLRKPLDVIERAADEFIAYSRSTPPAVGPFGAIGPQETARLAALSCVRLQRMIYPLLERLEVEETGGLIIEGGWGTGKTFHLGRFCRTRALANLPTVLIAARDLGDDERWLDGAARRQGTRVTGKEFIALLEMYALVTGSRALVVLDGINEPRTSGTMDHGARLGELIAELQQSAYILTVVSRRDDALVEWPGSPSWPVHWHGGVETDDAWRILQNEFGLPPLVSVLLHPDYRRPFVLRLLARCVVARPSPPSTRILPPPVGALLEEWIGVLASEYVRGTAGEQHRAEILDQIVRIVAEQGGADGTIPVSEIRGALRNEWAAGVVDDSVAFLIRAGVLSPTEESYGVRFALQRVAEHYRAILTGIESPGGTRGDRARDVKRS